MRDKLSSVPELDNIKPIMDVYNQLNEKCDIILEKIKKRKAKKNGNRQK
jgi:hypothetical protein